MASRLHMALYSKFIVSSEFIICCLFFSSIFLLLLWLQKQSIPRPHNVYAFRFSLLNVCSMSASVTLKSRFPFTGDTNNQYLQMPLFIYTNSEQTHMHIYQLMHGLELVELNNVCTQLAYEAKGKQTK